MRVLLLYVFKKKTQMYINLFVGKTNTNELQLMAFSLHVRMGWRMGWRMGLWVENSCGHVLLTDIKKIPYLLSARVLFLIVVVFWVQICRTLAYIHNCIGICHRDIKPQNLLVRFFFLKKLVFVAQESRLILHVTVDLHECMISIILILWVD